KGPREARPFTLYGGISRPRQADVQSAQIGVLRAHYNALLATANLEAEFCREGFAVDQDAEFAVAATALERAVHVARGLAPDAADAAAAAPDVGRQLELVAVAGAAQALLQGQAVRADGISCPAPDSFAAAVGNEDRSGATPVASEPGKGAAALGADGCRQHGE